MQSIYVVVESAPYPKPICQRRVLADDGITGDTINRQAPGVFTQSASIRWSAAPTAEPSLSMENAVLKNCAIAAISSWIDSGLNRQPVGGICHSLGRSHPSNVSGIDNTYRTFVATVGSAPT